MITPFDMVYLFIGKNTAHKGFG